MNYVYNFILNWFRPLNRLVKLSKVLFKTLNVCRDIG